MPDINSLDSFLDYVGSGGWAEYVRVEQKGSFAQIGLVIIILIMLISFIATYANKKGTFTRPDVSSAAHIYEVVSVVNAELESMYRALRDQGILKRAMEGFGGITPSQLTEGRLNPEHAKMKSQLRMGLFFVFKFHLNDKDAVANGKFGIVSLNKHFFTTRTQHHRYAMMIAAELILFQLYALSGRDPKSIVSNESFRKKHGEVIISLAGKMEEYAAMNERGIWSLTKHDRRVDDDIARFLGMTSGEVAKTDAELQQYSRSAQGIMKGESHIVVPEDRKFLHVLEKEIRHLERLIYLADEKLESVKHLSQKKGIDDEQRQKLSQFSRKWEPEISRLKVILSALLRIRDNKGSWKLKASYGHQWARSKKPDVGGIAEAVIKESGKEQIDVNKVHAILTSFTAAKADMIRLMQLEEAVV